MSILEDNPSFEEEDLEDDIVIDEADEEGSGHEEQDPEAEGDAVVPLTPPSFAIANSLPFPKIADRMEQLYKLKTTNLPKDKRPKEKDKLEVLLPPKILAKIRSPHHDPPESIYPLLRLLMPDMDSSRTLAIKEMTLAKLYARALQMSDASALLQYTNPQVAQQGTGDFSQVLYHVLTQRVSSRRKRSLTIGQLNDLLNELAAIKRTKSNHDWKGTTKATKPESLLVRQTAWVNRLLAMELSPLDHKWIVRIILRNLNMGVSSVKILQYYHPMGPTLWNAHNKLQTICADLCQPSLNESKPSDSDTSVPLYNSLPPYMQTRLVDVTFNAPFTPMCSERTGFGQLLTDLSREHRETSSAALALKHPAFCVETKLDGERMLVHYTAATGQVRMHTRRGNWYSDLYSPALGPAVRKALSRYAFDVILDGEVLAWDDGRQETIPFGNNRTIASLRHKYMAQHGLCEGRDKNLHVDETEAKVMTVDNSWIGQDHDFDEEAGRECWLQFVAFDVLFVDGVGAKEFLDDTVSEYVLPRPSSGSITSLSLLERKKILYKVLAVQPKEVEIVETLVVRPDGSSVHGGSYFSSTNPMIEFDILGSLADSIPAVLAHAVPKLDEIDTSRRRTMSDEQISQLRAHAVDRHYKTIVERMRLEGLLFKDLSTPYVVGEISRRLRYWHKFKPDYFNGSAASDIDMIIIGAYFATGLRRAGSPSSFLLACVDYSNENRFLPCCKVNGGSMQADVLQHFLRSTGYTRSTSEEAGLVIDLGRWFTLEGRTNPDFVSSTSHQSEQENMGWSSDKDTYPDLWIHPDDSCVVTLNAGEIVTSTTFSTGLTLRFPRITKLRVDGDAKLPSQVESDRSLWEKYQEIMKDRAQSPAVREGSPARASRSKSCRFLTEDQFADETKKKRSRKRKASIAVKGLLGTQVTQISLALKGLDFCLLEGRYSFEKDLISKDQAELEGWLEEGKTINNPADLEGFIRKHGGTRTLDPGKAIVIGGCTSDARVKAHVAAIDKNRRTIATTKRPSKPTASRLTSERLAKSPGVLRWSYLVSAVHAWLASDQDGPLELKPTPFDYLLRPDVPLDGVPQSSGFGKLSNTVELQRSLEMCANKRMRTEPSATDCAPWVTTAMNELAPDDRWIVSSPRTPFWPYTRSETKESVVAICDEETEPMESLIRTAGGWVSNDGTTVADTHDLGRQVITDEWIRNQLFGETHKRTLSDMM